MALRRRTEKKTRSHAPTKKKTISTKPPQTKTPTKNNTGGVKKEFFQLLVGELLSPDYGMLVYQPESRTFWFNACSLEGEEQFLLLGLVLGLAIYNRVLLDFPLPLALYKMLLGQPAGLRDLEDMQPTLGRSLRQLLQYDPQAAEGGASVEDAFCLTFSVDMDYFGDVRTVPLKPEGEHAPVREDNRHEYVELMVDFLLRRSVERQFAAFAQGFRILCDGPAIRLFNACELERLVCGEFLRLGLWVFCCLFQGEQPSIVLPSRLARAHPANPPEKKTHKTTKQATPTSTSTPSSATPSTTAASAPPPRRASGSGPSCAPTSRSTRRSCS